MLEESSVVVVVRLASRSSRAELRLLSHLDIVQSVDVRVVEGERKKESWNKSGQWTIRGLEETIVPVGLIKGGSVVRASRN